MQNIQDTIQDVKDKISDLTPNPPELKDESSAHDLKARLEWGEPALTIIDVRGHEAFGQSHIRGAMAFPAEELVERAKSSLDNERDIFIYGETDEQTTAAAAQLRSAGFTRVSALRGGLAAWKEIAGPTDGIADAQESAPKEAFNVVDQLKRHSETQSKSV